MPFIKFIHGRGGTIFVKPCHEWMEVKMRSLCVALGMAGALVIYGYVFSTAGHDHSKHGGEIHQHGPAAQDINMIEDDHHSHDHDHDH
jgi:hypothetical protein